MVELYIWLLRWFGILCTIKASVAGLFWIGSRDAEWDMCLPLWADAVLALICGINSLCILLIGNSCFLKDLLLGWLAGSLIAAAVMDLWNQMVYRFVWWSAGAAMIVIWFLRSYTERMAGESTGQIVFYIIGQVFPGLVLYIIVQQAVFGRLYGRADCHAFSICAVGMAVLGMSFEDFVIHMTLAYLGLTVVQFLSGNVAGGGRLKRPVPFIPYIVAAFWLWVDFTARKWYI